MTLFIMIEEDLVGHPAKGGEGTLPVYRLPGD
jgi:hypothetical protein